MTKVKQSRCFIDIDQDRHCIFQPPPFTQDFYITFTPRASVIHHVLYGVLYLQNIEKFGQKFTNLKRKHSYLYIGLL